MNRVAVNRIELEMLIESAVDERVVDVAFGPGSVKVLVTPENAWALDLLIKHRFDTDAPELGDVLRAIADTERSGVPLGCINWSLEKAERCG